jgi:tRNA (guanine10-N2)-methyltransferase
MINPRMPGYVPASKPYEMVDLVNDLVAFARYMLVPGGRLVFFLPTFTEEWDPVDVPSVEGMREISFGQGSAQEFNKWSRRLITMEKYSVVDENGHDKKWAAPDFVPLEMDFAAVGLEDAEQDGQEEAGPRQAKVPGHANFRERYIAGFPSTPSTPRLED